MVYRKSTIKVLLGPEGRQSFSAYRETSKDPEADSPRLSPRKHRDGRDGVFEKIGETNVYKRTRPFKSFQGRPTLERYPSNLELSGHKVEAEGDKTKRDTARYLESARTNVTTDSLVGNDVSKSEDKVINKDGSKVDEKQIYKDGKVSATSSHTSSAADGRISSTVSKSRQSRTHSGIHNATVSQNMLTDFGFRTSRTDTFSGHQRRRGASADLERLLEKQAERHIRTCQVVGNVKRSSKAQQSYQGLKDTVSPLHTPMSFSSSDRLHKSALQDKTIYRSDSNLDKTEMVPYMIQIRKSVGSISRTKTIAQSCQKNNPLPEISGQTLLVGTGITISS